MKMFNSIRVAVKLPVIMVTLSLMALVVTTVLSYLHARSTLTEEAAIRLQTIADAEALAVETLSEGLARDLELHAQSPLLHDAFSEFRTSLEAMPSDPAAHLREWYQDKNPYRDEGFEALNSAADGSGYSRAHALFHPYLRAVVESMQYEDAYLIDPGGLVIYSVRKGRNFAQILGGSNASPVLHAAFQQVVDARGTDRSHFVEFQAEADGQWGYVGREITNPRGRFLGVLVFRMSLDPLSALLQSPGEDGEVAGAGRSYIVSSSGALIADSVPGDDIIPLQTLPPTALQHADLEALSGLEQTATFSAEPMFLAGAHATFLGQHWSVFAEKSATEQLASARTLLIDIVTNIVVLLAVICGMGVWLARSVSLPLVAVGAAMRKITDRDLASGIPCLERGDEIGEIAKSLKSLRDDLGQAAAVEAENQFKSAALVSSSAASMIVDSDCVIQYVNPAAIALLRAHQEAFTKVVSNFDPEDVVGKSMDHFHETPSKARARLASLQDFPLSVDIRVGDARFALLVSAVQDASGDRMGYVVEWQDVTVERMQKAVINTIYRHQCTAEIDTTGVIEGHNDCLKAALGAGRVALGETRLADLIKGCAETDRNGADLWDALKASEQIYGRFEIESADGDTRWLEGTISPVLDRQNTALKYLLMASDVTEAQAKLAAAEAERKEIEAEQSQVVDAVSIALKRLSEGDLAVSLEDAFAPRYDQLRQDFNSAVQRLNETLIGVIENANAIRSEAREISNAADDLSQRTEKQAGTLEETAAALDELTASVRSAADGAARADAVVVEARSNAVNSGSVVKEAVDAMGLIETSSGKISKIIGVIDDIAFQTNLLALNAGVEAARAGEAGRGFAVVASEVRALAQRSSEAAKEISTLISTSSGHVSRGVELVDEAGRALEQIVEAVSGIADHVSEISGSAQQQSAGLAEINSSVNQLDQVTQQNAAMFEETTAASHALTREAQNLTDMVAKFKTVEADQNPSASPALVPEQGQHVPQTGAETPSSRGLKTAVGQGFDVEEPDNVWDDF